jgi:hypothetical protein
VFTDHLNAIEKARADTAALRADAAAKKKAKDQAEFDAAKVPRPRKAKMAKLKTLPAPPLKEHPHDAMLAKVHADRMALVKQADAERAIREKAEKLPSAISRDPKRGWMNEHVCNPAVLKAASGNGPGQHLDPEEYMTSTIGTVTAHVLDASLGDVLFALDPKSRNNPALCEIMTALPKRLERTPLADVLSEFEIPTPTKKDPARTLHWSALARVIAPNRSRRELLLRTMVQLVALTLEDVGSCLRSAIDGETPFDFDREVLAEAFMEEVEPDVPTLLPEDLAQMVADLSPLARAKFRRRLASLPETP